MSNKEFSYISLISKITNFKQKPIDLIDNTETNQHDFSTSQTKVFKLTEKEIFNLFEDEELYSYNNSLNSFSFQHFTKEKPKIEVLIFIKNVFFYIKNEVFYKNQMLINENNNLSQRYIEYMKNIRSIYEFTIKECIESNRRISYIIKSISNSSFYNEYINISNYFLTKINKFHKNLHIKEQELRSVQEIEMQEANSSEINIDDIVNKHIFQLNKFQEENNQEYKDLIIEAYNFLSKLIENEEFYMINIKSQVSCENYLDLNQNKEKSKKEKESTKIISSKIIFLGSIRSKKVNLILINTSISSILNYEPVEINELLNIKTNNTDINQDIFKSCLLNIVYIEDEVLNKGNLSYMIKLNIEQCLFFDNITTEKEFINNSNQIHMKYNDLIDIMTIYIQKTISNNISIILNIKLDHSIYKNKLDNTKAVEEVLFKIVNLFLVICNFYEIRNVYIPIRNILKFLTTSSYYNKSIHQKNISEVVNLKKIVNKVLTDNIIYKKADLYIKDVFIIENLISHKTN